MNRPIKSDGRALLHLTSTHSFVQVGGIVVEDDHESRIARPLYSNSWTQDDKLLSYKLDLCRNQVRYSRQA